MNTPMTDQDLDHLEALANAATDGEPLRCPECRDGKPRNCTGWAINHLDEIVECENTE